MGSFFFCNVLFSGALNIFIFMVILPFDHMDPLNMHYQSNRMN